MALASFSERQEDELQVLQAIYLDDVKDLRLKDAWKVRRPPELQITLRPQESMTEHETNVMVDLFISCPENYPDEVPKLNLKNPKGLSNQQVAELLKELQAVAKERKGEVMILELAQFVRDYLHANNTPAPKSFYEQMMKNKQKQEEKLAQEHEQLLEAIRRKEAQERQNMEDELQRRHEELKLEGKRRREARKELIDLQMTPIPHDSSESRSSASPINSASNATSKPARRRRTSTPKSEDDYEEGKYQCSTISVFKTKSERTVHCGKCLGHSSRGSVVYVAMDRHTGELLCIVEWILKWKNVNRRLNVDAKEEDDKQASKFLKQINLIEQEIFSLIKLEHKNLIHVKNFKYQQDPGKITVQILTEYIQGSSLSVYEDQHRTVAIQELNKITAELLQALVYLHGKGINHKQLRTSSVFIDQDLNVRLGDYSFDKRLQDLYDLIESERTNKAKASPEKKPIIFGRGTQRGDIYQLGLLILTLTTGQQTSDIIPQVPTHIPEDLKDFISKCIIRDEKKRWSAQQLLSHAFIKTPVYKSISNKTGETEVLLSCKTAENQARNGEDDDTEDVIFVPSAELVCQSRLYSEFDVLARLGKGGFGDVIKVRNKLDGRYYAIKRIPLNPRSKHFNKRITREVKLLSRLNHENVVRYYNSWIETTEKALSSDSSSITVTNSTDRETEKSKSERLDQSKKAELLGFLDNIEELAPPVVDESVEWSISYNTGVAPENSLSSDEEDEGDVFGTSFFVQADSSDCIDFEGEDRISDKNDSVKEKSNITEESVEAKSEFLYIQMEFCEKSTLRNCIDTGLFEDMERVWRLFREIVEGLVHIHEQGMIHRDLKPTNIFLDSNDHVKIGDFGLATSDLFQIQTSSMLEKSFIPANQDFKSPFSLSNFDQTDPGALTGKVGTVLYASPEVMMGGTKTQYTQKVDIYSLGIIFFEMCYKTLPTGMERVTVLGKIRQEIPEFPEDFDGYLLKNQYKIICWLLDHNPDNRPSSQQLLQSEFLPAPQLEEAELNEMLRSMLADSRSKPHKNLMNAIFTRSVELPDDILYDHDHYKTHFSKETVKVYKAVQETLKRIFSHHGCQELSSLLLMPKCELYQSQDQYMCLMDQHGGLVSLPYDHRVPFARLVAKSGITECKRFCIDRVYRDKKWSWSHPRVLIECAVDLVSVSTSTLVPDAEIIYIVQEIIFEFPALQSRNYTLWVNHTVLLKGVLMHCGVSEDKHNAVCTIMEDTTYKNEKQRRHMVEDKLLAIDVSKNSVDQIYLFLSKEGPFGQMCSWLRCITKTGTMAASFVKKGLHEIEAVLNHLDVFGGKMHAVISLRPLYNWQLYSGVMFKICCEIHRRKGLVMDSLAAGGRYDKLIEKFQSPVSKTSPHFKYSAVGVSIAFEKIVGILHHSEIQVAPSIDIVVCSVGHKSLLREKLVVVRELWSAGLKAEIWHDMSQDLEEVHEICKGNCVSHLLILKDGEGGMCRIRSQEKDRYLEKKLPSSEIVEYLMQKIHSIRQDSPDNTASSKSTFLQSQLSIEQQAPASSSSMPQTSITFIQSDNTKLSSNAKRRMESQIYSNILQMLHNLSVKCKVEILALDLDGSVVRTLAAHLEIGQSGEAFKESVGRIIDRHQRHKKYLNKIIDHIHSTKCEKTHQTHYANHDTNFPMILYGLKDDSYRILI